MQSYQNLHDTDIGAFFVALKKQIKSVSIKSEDVISFIGGLSMPMNVFRPAERFFTYISFKSYIQIIIKII